MSIFLKWCNSSRAFGKVARIFFTWMCYLHGIDSVYNTKRQLHETNKVVQNCNFWCKKKQQLDCCKCILMWNKTKFPHYFSVAICGCLKCSFSSSNIWLMFNFLKRFILTLRPRMPHICSFLDCFSFRHFWPLPVAFTT